MDIRMVIGWENMQLQLNLLLISQGVAVFWADTDRQKLKRAQCRVTCSALVLPCNSQTRHLHAGCSLSELGPATSLFSMMGTGCRLIFSKCCSVSNIAILPPRFKAHLRFWRVFRWGSGTGALGFIRFWNVSSSTAFCSPSTCALHGWVLKALLAPQTKSVDNQCFLKKSVSQTRAPLTEWTRSKYCTVWEQVLDELVWNVFQSKHRHLRSAANSEPITRQAADGSFLQVGFVTANQMEGGGEHGTASATPVQCVGSSPSTAFQDMERKGVRPGAPTV